MLPSLKRLFSRNRELKKPAPLRLDGSLNDNDFRQLSFTFAVIALSAQIACLDGPLTQEKYITFRESFPLQGGICGKIRSLFALACENQTPYMHYVTQIKQAFPGRQDLYRSLLERLFRIAAVGGEVSVSAGHMLETVAQILGISAADYAAISNSYNAQAQAQRVLGISKYATARALKARYLELMRRYHPDRFAGDELSPEVALLLQLKASEINEAYRRLSKKAA